MIGEMRDLETAKIAIQSALTGHLVLSTIHTNDAAGGVTRMLDMGVEDYLLTSTVNAILAQRLVRTLDPGAQRSRMSCCRRWPRKWDWNDFGRSRPLYVVYRPVPTDDMTTSAVTGDEPPFMELLTLSDPDSEG